jgi:hypothetical protein
MWPHSMTFQDHSTLRDKAGSNVQKTELGMQRVVFDPIDGRNVGMVERSQHLSFALKASHAFGVASERFGEYFHCHIPLQPGIACAVYLAHPPFAEQGKDFVVTEFVADGRVHTIRSPPRVPQSYL